MKQVPFIIMILLTQFLAGQNYQNICPQGVTFYYNFLPQDKLLAFRPDSVLLMPNLDTLFISYTAIQDSGAGGSGVCFDTTNGSVFGKKIIRRVAGGQFLFFNKNGDTITIQTQAALNQSWTMMHLSGGNYIQATTTSIAPETILGMTDQVKTITFQAKSPAGINIPHPFNNRIIKLSAHFGFSWFFQVYSAPELFLDVSLAGKQTPPIGVQYATSFDLFNFQIGDEFHYSGSYSFYDYSSQWKEIRKIVGRTDYPDSIVYLTDRCRREVTAGTPGYVSIHDTIIESYDLNDLFYSSLPDQFLGGYPSLMPWGPIPSCSGRVTFNGRLSKILYPDAICCRPCWYYGAQNFDNNEEYYTDGLGRTRVYRSGSIQVTMSYLEELVYFHKGSEIWGTPVANDCNTLVDLEDQTTSRLNHIGIVPNPAQYNLTIDLAIESVLIRELKIYNILGKQMAMIAISPLENQINLDVISWPRGVYVIKIDDKKNGTLAKVFILN